MDKKTRKKPSKPHREMLKVTNFESHWNLQFLDASFEDWITYLRNQNAMSNSIYEQATDTMYSKSFPSSFSSTLSLASNILYKWCQQLQQPTGVPHRALELYERFSLVNCQNCFENCLKNKDSFEEMLTTLRHQSLLHLVSCLQIASKLEDGYKVVTVSDAAMLLRQSNRPCDKSTILNSEVLVLVTLNHNVNHPPISDYVDTFICHLVMVLKKRPTTENCSQLLSVADKIYQIAMLYIHAIYFDLNTLVQRMVIDLNNRLGEQHKNNSEKPRTVHELQNDKVLLSAGVISAAAFLVQPTSAAFVMKELHSQTGAHPSDIAVVSSVLVNYLDPDVG